MRQGSSALGLDMDAVHRRHAGRPLHAEPLTTRRPLPLLARVITPLGRVAVVASPRVIDGAVALHYTDEPVRAWGGLWLHASLVAPWPPGTPRPRPVRVRS